MNEVLETIGILALIGLAVFLLVVFLLSFNVSECVQGGYATYKAVKKVGVCVGVDQDGTWKIEPLDDVRDRLGLD